MIDPLPGNEKHRQRIQADVEAFLRAGGKVETVSHTENHSYQQPPKRTRSEQVKYQKRHNKISA